MQHEKSGMPQYLKPDNHRLPGVPYFEMAGVPHFEETSLGGRKVTDEELKRRYQRLRRNSDTDFHDRTEINTRKNPLSEEDTQKRNPKIKNVYERKVSQ